MPLPNKCIVDTTDMSRMTMSAIYQPISEGATYTGVIQTDMVTPYTNALTRCRQESLQMNLVSSPHKFSVK